MPKSYESNYEISRYKAQVNDFERTVSALEHRARQLDDTLHRGQLDLRSSVDSQKSNLELLVFALANVALLVILFTSSR